MLDSNAGCGRSLLRSLKVLLHIILSFSNIYNSKFLGSQSQTNCCFIAGEKARGNGVAPGRSVKARTQIPSAKAAGIGRNGRTKLEEELGWETAGNRRTRRTELRHG